MKNFIFISIFLTSLSMSVIANENSEFYKSNVKPFVNDQFKECTSVTMWITQGKSTDRIDQEKIVKIPEGWKVVGTGVTNSGPIIFICR